ncbi:MAG: polyamine aminopropyltransferase [Thermoplasmata archaeon]
MEEWYGEKQTNDVMISFKTSKIIYSGKSKYQDILLIENETYGRILMLDGTVQLTEKDEFIYHEILAHIPLMSLTEPKKVLIIGGGDGGLAREILKHSVSNVDIVEIDEEVVNISKKFLPFVSSSYSDRRLRLFIEDGAEFVKKSKGKYDAVLIDSTDPVGAAAVLFTEEFYRNIKNLLKKDGIIGSQTGSPFMYPGHLKMAYENMKTLFNTIKIYTAPVPTYPGAIWSFTFATNGDLKRKRTRNFRTMFYNEEYHDTNINPEFIKELVH